MTAPSRIWVGGPRIDPRTVMTSSPTESRTPRMVADDVVMATGAHSEQSRSSTVLNVTSGVAVRLPAGLPRRSCALRATRLIEVKDSILSSAGRPLLASKVTKSLATPTRRPESSKDPAAAMIGVDPSARSTRSPSQVPTLADRARRSRVRALPAAASDTLWSARQAPRWLRRSSTGDDPGSRGPSSSGIQARVV